MWKFWENYIQNVETDSFNGMISNYLTLLWNDVLMKINGQTDKEKKKQREKETNRNRDK
jgi:hypothetical protein